MACSLWSTVKHCITLGIVAIVIAVISITIAYRNNVTVNTTDCGTILGLATTIPNGKTVYEFLNIPYAVPPVGPRRFQPAELLEGGNCYDGTLDATNNETVMCIQMMSGNGTEDCLMLSVRSTDLTASKPVVVWIHGGGLMVGNKEDKGYCFDGEVTYDLDVVTVNINFRLGYLGFAAWEEVRNEESQMYGNNGIRDQITALKWIRNNIASFGGNPNSVTIIGESGGGTAVLALVSSPMANNLFHRAISLSPAPEFRFDYKKGDEFQRYVVEAVGCTQDTLEQRRTCLMNVPGSVFSVVSMPEEARFDSIMPYFDFPMRYREKDEYLGLVVTDPAVITVAPRYLKNANFSPASKVKVIVSNMAQESSILSQFFHSFAPHINNTVFTTAEALNETLASVFKAVTDDDDIINKTYKMYKDFKSPQLLWDMLTTDMRSTCPINDVTGEMAKSSNHEVYRLYISTSMASKPHFYAFHAWETFALFGYTGFYLETYEPGTRDVQFRRELMNLVSKFAWDDVVKEGWETYPTSTLYMGNGDPMVSVSGDSPQGEICRQLAQLDLVKYGNQN